MAGHSRRLRARGGWVRWPRAAALGQVAVLALAVTGGCRTGGAGSKPEDAGARRTVRAHDRDPVAELRAAIAQDPSSPRVAEVADRLLASDAAADVRVTAWLAKADQAYAVGEDLAAIAAVDEGIAVPAGEPAVPVPAVTVEALRWTLARALARSGDPQRALDVLAAIEPALGDAQRGAWLGARAVALARAGRGGEGLAAAVEWFTATELPAVRAYAREQVAAALAAAGPLERQEWAARTDALGRCARGWKGAAPREVPAALCAPLPRRVVVALPRSGPLAGLADTQLGAVLAARRVDAARDPTAAARVELRWVDAGDEREFAGALRDALDRGAGGEPLDLRVIGPLGASASRRALELARAAGATVVLPSEGTAGAAGVGPALEARVAALVDDVLQAGRRTLVLAAPSSPYGDRAVAAVRAQLAGAGPYPKLIELRYAAATTSFAPTLEPAAATLAGAGAVDSVAVLIADAAPRAELLARELTRRFAARPEAESAARARRWLWATAEGLTAKAYAPGRGGLDGARVALAAPPVAADAELEASFVAVEGVAADDVARLVWRAWRVAVHDELPDRRPQVQRLEGGRVVDGPA